MADYVAWSDYSHNAPILSAAVKTLEQKWQANGMDPWFPARLGNVLRATRAFDEIHIKTVTLPMNPVLVNGALRTDLLCPHRHLRARLQNLPCASLPLRCWVALPPLTRFGTAD